MLTENDTDRITNLAEELKCHILSFLPSKDAIRTSVLSSRWRTLWTFVPVVYFQNDEELLNERFLQCVKSTLTRRDGQPIKKFSLRSDFEDRDWLELEACTNAALNCKVEHLELSNFHLFPPSLLPPSVLTCPTIVVLELMKFLISPSSITSPVNWPKLKTLYLYFNTFTSDDIVNFFLRLPCSSTFINV
ncbi:hypothetical protein L6164_000880 [Bauhinia variegata]|uniref:Uncharacterized protein n=1 Tax=Bauhinia variegata TaxID=167791 RepID=A0ACB9QA20_BAUVA|nr:hypothetical protein L6164_000880 [Bauhinia variegata]